MKTRFTLSCALLGAAFISLSLPAFAEPVETSADTESSSPAVALASAASEAAANLAVAPEAKKEESSSPKFKINPTGRILIDGAMFWSPQKSMFKDGVAIPDARLGVKMSYGKWNAKIDVGFAYGKVGLKDLVIGYTFDEKNSLKVGSFIHQFGLQSATSSSMKPTMEEPISNAIFNDARQLGIQYEYSGPQFLATASLHAEPSATTYILRPDQYTKEGWGARSRLVWRPFCEEGKVVQIGISGAYGSPQRHGDPDTHDGFIFATNYPTRVTQVQALNADVTDARGLVKLTPELLLNYNRFALESQYFWVNVDRKYGLPSFTGQGAYVTLRGLILGKSYSYSLMDGGLATPAPKSLELVLDYNYTSVSDPSAGIFGGRLNDFSATLNYYINKYMIARLHYSFTHTWDRQGAGPVSLNGIMARLQVIF